MQISRQLLYQDEDSDCVNRSRVKNWISTLSGFEVWNRTMVVSASMKGVPTCGFILLTGFVGLSLQQTTAGKWRPAISDSPLICCTFGISICLIFHKIWCRGFFIKTVSNWRVLPQKTSYWSQSYPHNSHCFVRKISWKQAKHPHKSKTCTMRRKWLENVFWFLRVALCAPLCPKIQGHS